MDRLTFRLKPRPPFRLDLTVWTLRRRPANMVDRWDGETYRRVLLIEEQPVEVAVTQIAAADTPRLEVLVRGDKVGVGTRAAVTAALARTLGLRIDLTGFYRLAARDPKLAPLAEQFRGMKPPRFPTIFEALSNAVACQQITLTQGIALLNRLAAIGGAALEDAHTFPTPEGLARLRPATFRRLGFSEQKGSYIRGLAKLVSTGKLDLSTLSRLGDADALEELVSLRGVGRWTAEYVLLRGLGRLNVFPGDDVGARNNLARWLRLRKPLDYAGVRRVTARWEPYAGLVYFHLLLRGLNAAGYLEPANGAATTNIAGR